MDPLNQLAREESKAVDSVGKNGELGNRLDSINLHIKILQTDLCLVSDRKSIKKQYLDRSFSKKISFPRVIFVERNKGKK